MKPCKVAMVQVKMVEEQTANVAYVVGKITEAAAQGADIVVLPEIFCCPYTQEHFIKNGQPEGGPTWQALSAAARDNNVYLVGGSVVEQVDDVRYNTCYVFDRQGNQIGKHRKVHLFDIDVEGGQYYKESDSFAPGNSVTTFETEFGTMGVNICYDNRFPELARLMALRGAKVLFCPAAFNMTTGPAHWEVMFRSRAVDNQAYTIGVASARNEEADYVAYGHSMVVAPWGNVVAEMDEKPGMMITEIDLDEVDKIRQQLPLLLQRRTDVYSVTEA